MTRIERIVADLFVIIYCTIAVTKEVVANSGLPATQRKELAKVFTLRTAIFGRGSYYRLSRFVKLGRNSESAQLPIEAPGRLPEGHVAATGIVGNSSVFDQRFEVLAHLYCSIFFALGNENRFAEGGQ